MISKFWHRIARRWQITQERHKLTLDHMVQMIASEQLIDTYRTLQREVTIRSQNVDTNRQVDLLGKAIHFLVLADRDLQVLSYPYQEPWRDELHNLHFRVQALIIYEVLQGINAIIGADVRKTLSAHNLITALSKLNAENSKLTQIERLYHQRLKEVRNTVIAHRDIIDPTTSMMRAIPSALTAGLITQQVQTSLRALAVALLGACLEIAKTLPPNSPPEGQ